MRDGSLVAATWLRPDDETLTIVWIAVFAHARRHGAGKLLIEQAMREANGMPVRVVTFGADHPHPEAPKTRAFYEAMGFAVTDEVPETSPDGTSRQAFIR